MNEFELVKCVPNVTDKEIILDLQGNDPVI